MAIVIKKSLKEYLEVTIGSDFTSWAAPSNKSRIYDRGLFINAWEKYIEDAIESNVWDVLKEHLIQLQFPIKENISKTLTYRNATRRGKLPSKYTHREGLSLNQPDAISLEIYASLAGSLPVISVFDRADFVMVVQAITQRNEPFSIPDSMGACMVTGYNNWSRIHSYKKDWEAKNPDLILLDRWQDEFRALITQKHLYQDCFLILSCGSYSNISAEYLNLEEKEWQNYSSRIRKDHESTHYFTKRFFGVANKHLLDELIADYVGIVSVLGKYRADWFLLFMGLENFPIYRSGARFENYVPDEIMKNSEQAQILMEVLHKATLQLEHFDQSIASNYRQGLNNQYVILAIASMSLAELAQSNGSTILKNKFSDILNSSSYSNSNPQRRILV